MRLRTTLILVLATATAGGCGVGGLNGAKQLIEPVATPGRVALAGPLTATTHLLKTGRIDAHKQISAEDGTMLDVWIIKARNENGKALAESPRRTTVLVLHGMTISKGWMLKLGEKIAAAGYDVVLPDFRAHGDSEGRYITWGVVETHDLITIVDSLLGDRLIAPQTYAVGTSMGGCVAVQYAAADKRCKGAVTLAAPTGIRGVAKRLSPLADDNEIDDVLSRAGALGGFDPENASAVKAAAKLTVPLIVVHGLWDAMVPFNHAEQIYAAAAGPRKLIPRYWQNHSTIMLGQEKWIVDRVNELGPMAITLGRDH